jgi:hypothetical protein
MQYLLPLVLVALIIQTSVAPPVKDNQKNNEVDDTEDMVGYFSMMWFILLYAIRSSITSRLSRNVYIACSFVGRDYGVSQVPAGSTPDSRHRRSFPREVAEGGFGGYTCKYPANKNSNLIKTLLQYDL